MRIGLFDSGVGGLNVLKEFIKEYPENVYYYYGDTKNIPYGNKDYDTLLNLASRIIKFFDNLKVDLIIVACGTISSTCYYELTKLTNIKIYNVISPTITYLKGISNKKIALFATNRTVDSHIFKNNINDVLEIKTSEFVPMIENNEINDLTIKKYTDLIADYDILILGCTHYPIIKDKIKEFLPNIQIVNMGEILVNDLQIINNSKFEINLYFTHIDDNLIKNINNILDCNYTINLIDE